MSATKSTPKKAKRRRNWRPAFLRAMRDGATVAGACEAAKIDRSTAYRERQKNEEFALAWHDVEETGTDELEREAVRRAIEGSDTLLIFLLKNRRETYSERTRVEHSGQIRTEPKELIPADPDWHREALEAAQAAGLLPVGTNGNGNGNGHHP